ncbi:MAG: hypothetical protein QNJ54_25590 [Prochloraceae cyanobacterium]|nr:hypothetical protein [Prochloraceae cyanobacterium]
MDRQKEYLSLKANYSISFKPFGTYGSFLSFTPNANFFPAGCGFTFTEVDLDYF